jgi:hypothetical protein
MCFLKLQGFGIWSRLHISKSYGNMHWLENVHRDIRAPLGDEIRHFINAGHTDRI